MGLNCRRIMENPTGEEGQLMRAAALLPGTRKRNRETSGSDLAALAAFVWAVSYGPFRMGRFAVQLEIGCQLRLQH
jgi:hypothetical protein